MSTDYQDASQQSNPSSNPVPVLPTTGSLAASGSGGSRDSPAYNSGETLALRLQHVENLCQDLQREKNVMEDQFGQQRRKFMNLMVQKDEELSQVKRSVEQLSSELQHCQQQIRDKEEEVIGVAL